MKILRVWRRKLHDLWYTLKCNLWHRYTTIKPRYLTHHFVDRDVHLAHCAFEILSQFYEQEQKPLRDSYPLFAEHKKGYIEQDEYNIQDSIDKEIQYLYRWWHDYYNGFALYKIEELWNIAIQSKNDEDGRIAVQFEDDLEKELDEMLHRLIAVRQYLWT